MKEGVSYEAINRNTWNQKTKVHIDSAFYDMPSFLGGKSTLNSIELELLGDINGKSILHLQCHFGQDSISLSQLGAQVTGVDFSEAAIDKARELAKQLKTNAAFILSSVYDLPKHHAQKYDMVYTSYGVLGWLPDMQKWAEVVSHFLKPGGQLVLVEFHPTVWMFDNDFEKVEYSYFNVAAIEETEKGSYTNRNVDLVTTTITWNHNLSEVISTLLDNGLTITHFNEYNYSPYNCLVGMEEFEKGKFRIQKFGNKLPLVYALAAVKK
jgi:2-polyprenyl-3-methyl-5-hydroxy-6-metoxy-1,4-benzoquinol methylase